DLMVTIKQRHRILPNELNSAQREFNCKCFFIYRLKKTGSELAVYANRSANNLLGDFGVSESLSCFPAFLIHLLDRSFCSRFFPSGIVRQRGDRDLFFFDQLSRRVFWWKGWGKWFLCAGSKFLRKLFHKALGWPCACFAESANRATGNVVANGFE